MNSTTPKRYAGILLNWNVPFQSKNQNGDRNSINSYGSDKPRKILTRCFPLVTVL